MAFLDFFTGVDSEAEQARQDDLDAKIRAENERDRLKYGEDWFAQTERNLGNGAIADVEGEVDDAFWQGWGEGADNIRSVVGGTIDGDSGGLASAIPWQVWAAGAAFLAYKLGLFKSFLK
jgi:hypothetical protein